ncbi:hypothetical protein EHQ16_05240 [Leptospira kanakyensis]|uniref:Uncharacterized protein n=1 Tax=Leptospira kanakyensis TaxID=2484968 RepID=A0A6N4QEV1_9LEPT|nr:hypothetical protein [Leptospira kanakyensis]TGK50549.1 hypothetical protein EHQ11_12780 [Leptospira kanakyensis]TGK63850.1 hypothetical protein EHQ16_05240 [Leptospira kanakyensis]TGK69687.1 hypothetical protein EHQ18_12940 [Leptospira kanakyensis]
MKQKLLSYIKFLPLGFLTFSIAFTIYIILNGYLIKEPENKLDSSEIVFLETFIKNVKSKDINQIYKVLNSNIGDKNSILKVLNEKEFYDTVNNAIPKVTLFLKDENYNLESVGLKEGKSLQFLLENKNGESTYCSITIGKNNKGKLEIAGFEFTNIKLSISEIILKDKLKTENLTSSNYLIIGYILFTLIIWTAAYITLIYSKYSSEKKYYFLIFLFVFGITYDWNSSELLEQYQFISMTLNPLSVKKTNFLENWKLIISFPLGAIIFLAKILITTKLNNEKN